MFLVKSNEIKKLEKILGIDNTNPEKFLYS